VSGSPTIQGIRVIWIERDRLIVRLNSCIVLSLPGISKPPVNESESVGRIGADCFFVVRERHPLRRRFQEENPRLHRWKTVVTHLPRGAFLAAACVTTRLRRSFSLLVAREVFACPHARGARLPADLKRLKLRLVLPSFVDLAAACDSDLPA
jgi:hypothetical protein